MTHPAPPGRRALRTAALYAVLVGAPTVGVAATLHVGRTLTAPPAVGGVWLVDPAAGGCARAAGTLRIEQSGARIDGLYAPAADGAGEVAFRGHVGEAQAVLGEPGGCERVEVAVSRDPARPDSLAAVLQTGACGCRTTEATLHRAPADPLVGAH